MQANPNSFLRFEHDHATILEIYSALSFFIPRIFNALNSVMQIF